MTINFTQLRAFHAVARNGSFTRAAKDLHVSQPTVSERVRELETGYGIQVFTRAHRQVKLTVVGRSLYEMTQRLFGIAGETEAFLRAAADNGAGHLRVSCVLPVFIVEVLTAFRQDYPQVKISVSAANSAATLSSLLAYEADVGVLSDHDPDQRFFTRIYNSHSVVAIVDRSHPWADRTGLRIGELNGKDMVLREIGSNTRRAFEAAAAEAEVSPNVVLELASGEAIREAVAAGHGIGVFGERALSDDPRIRVLPFIDVNIRLNRYFACLRERKEEFLVQAFFNAASKPR